MRSYSHCPRCLSDHGDLIQLLWRCPKLHRYWTGVVSTLNSAFQVTVQMDTKPFLLGIVDDIPTGDDQKQAIARALFQARKLILRHWKAVVPPALREWLAQMGDTLRLEKYIYQHRGRPQKFDKLWSPWLDTPGISPIDLVMDRLLL